MAIRFDGVGTDNLVISSGALDYNSPYTIMGWIMVSVDLNAVSSFFSINDGTANNRDTLRTTSSGTVSSVFVNVASTGTGANGTDLVVGTYYHAAMVRESVTSLKLYINGNLDATNAQDVTGRAASTTMNVGVGNTTGSPMNGRVYALKAWSAALTLAEVQQEMRIIRPNRTANLFGFWPMRPGSGERTKDYSGNGHTWTENGTLTDEDAPPVSWGAPPGLRALRFLPEALMATGTATLDFGAFPGTGDCSAVITGQTTIVSGSLIEAWLLPSTSVDHSSDEHVLAHDVISVVAADIVVGTGFTIYGLNASVPLLDQPVIYGQWNVAWAWL